MRLVASLGLGLAIAIAAAPLAEAASRKPLRVTVQKRSYFDAGKIVPVGSLNRYASQTFYASPAYSHAGERFGEGALPGRIGAGVNPFANSFSTGGF